MPTRPPSRCTNPTCRNLVDRPGRCRTCRQGANAVHRGGELLAFDRANCQAMARRCHDRKTAEEPLKRANPGYGVTAMADYLKAKAAEAERSPAQLNRYLRLHLNVRTKQAVRWIPLEVWDSGGGLVDVESLAGRTCCCRSSGCPRTT